MARQADPLKSHERMARAIRYSHLAHLEVFPWGSESYEKISQQEVL
jgi:hypothetical protein